MPSPSPLAFLTIDDAPSPDTPSKLATLRQRGITAVWFCRGELIEADPRGAAAILEEGHVIGNHSHDHPRFSTIPLDACIEQVSHTERAIEAIHAATGIPRVTRLFRFPFGDRGGSHEAALQYHLHAAGLINSSLKDIQS